MKMNRRKKPLTFGGFIVPRTMLVGGRRASGFVWLAANAYLVEFRGSQRSVFSKQNFNYRPS